MQMIYEFTTGVNRANIFHRHNGNINIESVKAYIKRLEEWRDKIDQANWDLPDFMKTTDSVAQKIKELLSNELQMATIYLDIHERKKAKDFDQWTFVKKEDRDDFDNTWNASSWGDLWIRNNGKTKVQIEIKDNLSSTRITLRISNESRYMDFVYGYGKEISRKVLYKQESIDRYIETLKAMAVDQMNDHLFPTYCIEQRNFEKMKELLHITEE